MSAETALRAAFVGETGPWVWVERNGVDRILSHHERLLVSVMCLATRLGPWNLRWTTLRRFGLRGAAVATRRDLATFDGDALTRMVIVAHELCCRVEVRPHNPGHLLVCLWERDREGGMSERHPTIEQAIADVRASTYLRSEP